MKLGPLPFSAPMVQAERDGRKTQTRRALRKQPYISRSNPPKFSDTEVGDLFICPDYFPTTDQPGSVITECTGLGNYHCMGQKQFAEKHSPYGLPGDRLWVREEHYCFGYWEPVVGAKTKTGREKWRFVNDTAGVSFDPPARFRKARHHKDPSSPEWHKRLARFMPRRYARTILEIVNIRVERLQTISEADCLAEGIKGITKDGKLVKYGIPDLDGYPGTDNTGWEWQDWCVSPVAAYQRLWEIINGPGSWDANPWVWVIEFKRVVNE